MTFKHYFFDGTMLIRIRVQEDLYVLEFAQTNEKRTLGPVKVNMLPDLFFIFQGPDNVDQLIAALEDLKEFMKK